MGRFSILVDIPHAVPLVSTEQSLVSPLVTNAFVLITLVGGYHKHPILTQTEKRKSEIGPAVVMGSWLGEKPIQFGQLLKRLDLNFALPPNDGIYNNLTVILVQCVWPTRNWLRPLVELCQVTTAT